LFSKYTSPSALAGMRSSISVAIATADALTCAEGNRDAPREALV
jgi:hypothetical protein